MIFILKNKINLSLLQMSIILKYHLLRHKQLLGDLVKVKDLLFQEMINQDLILIVFLVNYLKDLNIILEKKHKTLHKERMNLFQVLGNMIFLINNKLHKRMIHLSVQVLDKEQMSYLPKLHPKYLGQVVMIISNKILQDFQLLNMDLVQVVENNHHNLRIKQAQVNTYKKTIWEKQENSIHLE